jgi:Phage integrase family
VSAAPVRVAARRAARCEHVFGDRLVDAETTRWAARIDPGFLAEAGWDATLLVLFPPAAHPLLGRPVCRAPGCATTATARERLCQGCRRRLTEHGLSIAEVDQLPTLPAEAADARSAREEGCPVVACRRPRRHHDGVYCEAHQQRWRAAREDNPRLDERWWRATEAPVSRGGEVSLAGLAPLVITQLLLGLQQRCRLSGVKTREGDLRIFCNELRASRAATLADYRDLDAHRDQVFTSMVNALTTQAARAMSSPETEIGKDVWDLAVFGHSGTLDFTVITQPWLRQITKRWAADDLPRRRIRPGRRTSGGLHVRHHIGCVARLSQSLRQRLDRGEIPAALGRVDMEAFLHRLSYLASVGKISGDARIRACREVRAVLTRARALGLTRPGGPAAGLGEDFALHRDDVPAEPEPSEPGRDLPAEIMRQVCAHLPRIPSAEMRTGIELAIDTGRRPEEICDLPYDCLARDDDGSPVLVYDNHKANRLGRRLPISEATATLITTQQKRIRTRYPDTPVSKLKLLPTDRRNPDGSRAITAFSLAFHHRVWINTIPDLRTTDGIEFDRRRIVLYAYRHSYAQRHADAGVPIDVLRQLMDHSKMDTTKQYYHVGEARRREAVDRVAAMQFDRHGNRVWRDAKALLDSEHARRAVGEVAVPFGVCAEPSNVKAGGGACPYRFRCAGCDHFRTDVSYLPDLQAYLDDLLRTRERLRAATDIDAWARTEATPSTQEIARIRRLINRITTGLDDLTADERAYINNAVATVRRHRAVTLGMPRARPALPDLRPGGAA